MNSRFIQCTALAALLVCLIASLAEADSPSSISWRQQYDNAYREMQTQQRPMLVFIKSDACAYCKQMERKTYSNPSVVTEVSQRFVPTVINSSVNPALAQQFGACIYPTTVIVASDGSIVASIPGYVTADKFQAKLRETKTKTR